MEAGPGEPSTDGRHTGAGRAALAFWVFLGGLLVVRIVAIYTESVNWDEFMLLSRAFETGCTGELVGGGRPGLATFLLIPVVEGCRIATDSIHVARWIWTVLVITAVLGFWRFLVLLLGEGARARSAARFGVALLVFGPVFLRWSVQVRTDQGALAFGLWGAVALLASRRRAAWGLLAGVLFGVGFLFTQKVVYIAGLALAAAFGRDLIDRNVEWKRDAVRLLLTGIGGIATLLIYQVAVSSVWGEPTVVPGGAIRSFEFYRATTGLIVYEAMIPTLIPHLLLFALLLWLILSRRSRALEHRTDVILGFGMFVLGGCVMVLHGSAFPYFWMTLGLFPAVGGAFALRALGEVGTERMRTMALGGAWAVLALAALFGSWSMTRDSQEVQRTSLRFVAENFAAGEYGFQGEHALFCQGDPDPFGVYITPVILGRFFGPDAEAYTADFLETFRTKPVMFIVDSWRLPQFPEAVREMILGAYTPYRHAVWAPGRTVTPEAGQSRPFEVIVPGRYRWWPASPEAAAGALRVGDVRLESGEVIELDVGSYPLALEEGTAGGILALELETPPDPASIEPFYGGGALAEFFGWPWWRSRP